MPDAERHVILRLAGKPGEEFHWVLFPRAKDEPAPRVERLAPGVVRVTHAEGSDWIFTASDRIQWSGDEVAFQGTAGAVRLGKDGHATLQLLAGTGEVSYRGAGLRGVAPLEKTFAAGAFQPGIEDVKSAMAFTISAAVLKPGQAAVEHITTEPFNRYAKDKVTINGGRGAVRILDNGKIRYSTPEATYVELTCGPLGLRGMGPFDLTYAPDGWCGSVDGTRRTLVMSCPEKLLRPGCSSMGRSGPQEFRTNRAPGPDDRKFNMAWRQASKAAGRGSRSSSGSGRRCRPSPPAPRCPNAARRGINQDSRKLNNRMGQTHETHLPRHLL